jgi:hypothetical protein
LMSLSEFELGLCTFYKGNECAANLAVGSSVILCSIDDHLIVAAATDCRVATCQESFSPRLRSSLHANLNSSTTPLPLLHCPIAML